MNQLLLVPLPYLLKHTLLQEFTQTNIKQSILIYLKKNVQVLLVFNLTNLYLLRTTVIPSQET